MTILGKLLAIGNVLAAVGFLYLAASDWAIRHKWAYAVYRHELTLRGLPVDDQEADPTDDAPHVEKLSEKTLQDMFQQAGGRPVSTQKADVERARGEFKSTIDGLGDEAAKRERFATVLLPLARTRGEREALRSRIATKPIDELMADADTLFQIGGTPAPDSMAALVMPHHERTAIANLLYALYPNAEAQPRLQAVLGLVALNDAINRQAAHLHSMEEQTYAENARERTHFAVHYHHETDRLQNLAFTQTDREFALLNQQREKQRHEELLDNRKKEKAEVIGATEAARDRHKTTLDLQRQEEQQIFQSQQLFHRTKLENAQLEQTIRALEKTGGEGKKP